MSSSFFAMLSRMKYIKRWALMRNSEPENISEHSLEVSMLAHGLAVLGNRRLGKHLDADRCAVIGLYHDAGEILTGDMPTPIKYYNRQIASVFHDIEDDASNMLLAMLPEDIREDYRGVFFRAEGEEELWRIVKAADKISALIKCIEEAKAGNREFDSAAKTLEAAIHALQVPEAELFLTEFLPAYYRTLDELSSQANETV